MSVKQEGSNVHKVTHYHFTSWPDHGVPQFATSLINFIKRVQKDHNKDKGVPLLVHCSAGVGRTGTFVMLDSMMERLRVKESVNVYEFLEQMRAKRMYMVQTLPQYVFIHDALDEMITCGDTTITAADVRMVTARMKRTVKGKRITGYEEQLQLLDEVSYQPEETAFSDGKDPSNIAKNRYPNILPLNTFRPRLRIEGSASDYINASFVDGYKRKNAYIVTQGPMESTVVDFWHMVWSFKSRSLIQLCNIEENEQEVCHKYWPVNEGERTAYGPFDVTLQSETISEDYVVRKLHIVSKGANEGHVVTQFHYTAWPEHGLPKNSGSLIELIDLLTRAQMNTGNKAITVVCNDGVGRSGAFLCIHSQLERLKTEGEVDIFKYLKSARTRRIGLLSDPAQYSFVHEMMLSYIDSFDLYANFKSV